MVSLNEALIIAFIASAVIIYFFLPETIPLHWSASGHIDVWGQRWFSLLIPLFAICLYYLWELIPRVVVYKKNFKKLGVKYEHLLTNLILIIILLYLLTILSAYGLMLDIKYFIIIPVSIFIIYFGTLMKYVKRNYFIGIKTPWTLSSEKAWNKTHERGSRLFQAYGFILLSLLILPAETFFWVLLTPLVVIIIYSYCYSYEVWKKDKKAIRK